MALMRLFERLLSSTLTASTPASRMRMASATVSLASHPREGRTSTLTTSSPPASFAPQAERSANGTSGAESTAPSSGSPDGSGTPRGWALNTNSRM